MDSLTLAIPTRNRADLWKDGRVLGSILDQTDPDFELIVVDDDSTDETLAVLRPALKHCPQARLFTCNPHGNCTTRASVIPDNVAMRHAGGAIFAHSDDDVILDKNFVAQTKRWFRDNGPSVVYGALVFVDLANPDKVLMEDPRFRHLGKTECDVRLQPEWKGERGAVYATLRDVLRFVGGHDLRFAEARGADTRLGHRLRQVLPTWFSAQPGLIGQHLGYCYFQKCLLEARVEEMFATRKSPFTPATVATLVANGGLGFWRDGAQRLATELVL